MKLGTAFVVIVPNKDSERKFLEILSRRAENYPIVKCEWVHEKYYPAKWLVSSLDGCLFSFSPLELMEIKGLGLIVKLATPEDV